MNGKKITLRISHDAEKLINRLDMNIGQAIAKGLKLLEYAENGRLALLKEDKQYKEKPEIELIFSVKTDQNRKKGLENDSPL